ncbi:hypothetical protein [Aeromonas hydrophila]|uniref:hypothetical protein n=1 Tax=Aeromonas hydrophila TaxID=644 RepID=UPI002B47A3C9|nr:hypothetical protein [Aeromonas hydrophila]
MIDLDDLEINLNWYESRIKHPEPGVIYHLDYNELETIRELLGRLRSEEADAKRWRKLVEMNDSADCELAVCTWHGGYEYSMIPDLQEVIDAHLEVSP